MPSTAIPLNCSGRRLLRLLRVLLLQIPLLLLLLHGLSRKSGDVPRSEIRSLRNVHLATSAT